MNTAKVPPGTAYVINGLSLDSEGIPVCKCSVYINLYHYKII